MNMKLENKHPHLAPYLNENGAIIIPDSTEENLEIAKCLPSKKRLKILMDALSQADLEDDVVFVTSFEALSGFYKVAEGE